MTNLKKYSTKQLLKSLVKAEGERLETIREILISRGVIQETEQVEKDSIEELLIEARKNKGAKVMFLCTKTKKIIPGIIKGVRLDKRNNSIQYRIKTLTGMFGKGINSKDLEFCN